MPDYILLHYEDDFEYTAVSASNAFRSIVILTKDQFLHYCQNLGADLSN